MTINNFLDLLLQIIILSINFLFCAIVVYVIYKAIAEKDVTDLLTFIIMYLISNQINFFM